MKLIIQIPCYNEEKTLPLTFADLPKVIEGIDMVEFQVIDDGSTDKTVEVAKKLGIHHIISFKKNKGLASAFKAGVDNALINNADILVNTDGDNQYCGKDIIKLVRPILSEDADMVIGCRPIDNHPEFSFLKKKFQKLGSWVLRKVSNTTIKDAASGFRAYNKSAMLHMNIYSDFSYCMETIIQASYSNLKIVSVDIDINPQTRESHLFKNIFQYVWKQGKTIISIFLLYRASWVFNSVSILILLLSFFLFVRYLIFVVFIGAPGGFFWPSIILAGVLLVIAFQVFLVGILVSLISSVRKLSEDINYRVKELRMDRLTTKNSREN